MDEPLIMWTIYDRPTDEKEYRYVARRFFVMSGVVTPTMQVMRSNDLEFLRGELAAEGLTCIARDVTDQPHIVETWF